MALDATVGGEDSNSYVTRAEATAYFGDRLYTSAWTAASDADKDKALVTATRRIDQEEFRGSKVDDEQALKWPRHGTYDTDGFYYAGDEIPQPLKDAVCEYALELLSSDALKQSQLANFAHIKIGPLDITPKQPQSNGALPAQARRLLSHVLMSSPYTLRVLRG